MTSPSSPRVHVTTVTGRPEAAHVASNPPVARVSSSGWAWTASSPPVTCSGALGASEEPCTVGLVEDDLPDPDLLRRDLDTLVLAGELEGLLQGEVTRRHQVLEVVRGGLPHVGELLLLGDVDVHVLVAGVLTDDHALVHLLRRVDEEGAALLQVDHRERRQHTDAVRHERPVDAGLDRPGPRLVTLGDRGRDARAAGVGEELRAEADE